MLAYAVIVTFMFGALMGSVATVLVYLKMTKDEAQNLDVPDFMKTEIPSQPTILVGENPFLK